jgi:hypothetical protein
MSRRRDAESGDLAVTGAAVVDVDGEAFAHRARHACVALLALAVTEGRLAFCLRCSSSFSTCSNSDVSASQGEGLCRITTGIDVHVN